MTVSNYCKTREEFEAVGFGFKIITIYHGSFPRTRLVCWSNEQANKNATNGVRSEIIGSPSRTRFYAFMPTSHTRLDALAGALAKESVLNQIKFVHDDEMTRDAGMRVFRYYHIKALKSPMVV